MSAANTTSERHQMQMAVKDSIPIEPAELESKYVARFHELVDDSEIFADIKTPAGQRRHFHVISEGGHLGLHDLPEVFILLQGKFAILYGDRGEHSIELDPFDTISVPVGLIRTFKNIGNVNGLLMVICDGPGEILGKLSVTREIADNLRQTSPGVARSFGLMESGE